MPDFVQTIIHEMGHVLGLSHTKTKESVMFPTIYAGPAGSHYALHQEDISRVQAIYGMLFFFYIPSSVFFLTSILTRNVFFRKVLARQDRCSVQ
ncbi:matrilysin-like [Hydractinia symbiolongicarpus]|uniref:matrilysin-like n=1 Tax=Hydractinia symbiolongicarpus TaxID=13093 RepID=UPI00254E5981|nr:matrilysin-like [Hydractinia symbiolongicarpus]